MKEVRAIREIRKGEEVLVDYLVNAVLFPTASERRDTLDMKWDFVCDCSLCSSDHEKNDIMRKKVQKIHDQIPYLVTQSHLLTEAANAALQKCNILETCEDMVSDLPAAYLELYEILVFVARAKSVLGNIDALIASLAEKREEYRVKAYEISKKTRLINRKEMYNKTIRKLGNKIKDSSNKLI